LAGAMRRVAALLSFAALCLSVVSCGSCKRKDDTDGKLRVATSIFPVYDLVRSVAGQDADVILLLQPGRNEHHFDPTPRDVEQVAAARVGVMVGLGLDPWMRKLMKDAAPKARVLAVGDKVKTMPIKLEAVGGEEAEEHDKDHDHDHDHEKGAVDPHVWLDPRNAITIAKAIADELAAADPAHAQAFKDRADAFEKSTKALDAELETRMKALPKKQLITFHGSFGYFAARYGLEIVAVIEPFPGSTPTGEYIAKVLEVVGEKKVSALFSEPQLDPRPAKIIAEQAKLPLGVLDPVGGGPETDSYEKMLRFDAAQLEKLMK
jgi:ABC-type Zn uptake system ZnuABC Zn-binding protein ZnuA